MLPIKHSNTGSYGNISHQNSNSMGIFLPLVNHDIELFILLNSGPKLAMVNGTQSFYFTFNFANITINIIINILLILIITNILLAYYYFITSSPGYFNQHKTCLQYLSLVLTLYTHWFIYIMTLSSLLYY